MTQDEIIEMAQECKLIGMRPFIDGIYTETLIDFAKLVAAKEREACAKVCDEYSAIGKIEEFDRGWLACAKNIAFVIRARTEDKND